MVFYVLLLVKVEIKKSLTGSVCVFIIDALFDYK